LPSMHCRFTGSPFAARAHAQDRMLPRNNPMRRLELSSIQRRMSVREPMR
jgi:hypothetical protein